MAHAVDRNKIVETSFLGYADPGSSIVSPATGIWYDKTIQPETFDLAMANSLLDQAGYAKGADGIRVANGHPMSYTVIFPQSQTGTGDRTFQILQTPF
jgi:peptide/nickel transport system substrate-binding protein